VSWRGSVLIVGGSLSGLTAALALAHEGRQIILIERAPREELESTGGGLGVQLDALATVVGADPRSGHQKLHFLVDRIRTNVAWSDLYAWLFNLVRDRKISIRSPDTVTRVSSQQDGRMTVDLASGCVLSSDLIIGADGYRSTVRQYVDPEQLGVYAGYLIWRCLVPESELSTLRSASGSVDLQVHVSAPYQIVGYAVPGEDGATTQGKRRLSMAWYDPTRTEVLNAAGCLRGTEVIRSLTPDEIPASTGKELVREAERRWPDPWAAAVQAAVRGHALFGTPISEFTPDRMIRGRGVLVGDAAHTLTPMTGAGFSSTLEDIDALAHSLDENGDLETALERFETKRLADARALCASGRRWSSNYLRQTGFAGFARR
jgi:2-polyprenyl-6-methoxyphenol hydroxylase-like FAD-dependent oxidoreductase